MQYCALKINHFLLFIEAQMHLKTEVLRYITQDGDNAGVERESAQSLRFSIQALENNSSESKREVDSCEPRGSDNKRKRCHKIEEKTQSRKERPSALCDL